MVEMALQMLSEKDVVELDDERPGGDGVEPDGGALLGAGLLSPWSLPGTLYQ
jgi:hypothetical protein